jgi:hypothetical protein
MERTRIGSIEILPAAFPAPTQHPVSLLNLYGWDYDSGSQRLYLHWQLYDEDYEIVVKDVEGGVWSGVAIGSYEGYWTSVHDVPQTIAAQGVEVEVNGNTLRLPGMDGHYILYGDVAALIDWQVSGEAVSVTLLPFGATYGDIQFQFASESEQADFTPVGGSIPSFKWAYNRPITSSYPIAGQEVRFIMYDGFTGRVVPSPDVILR